MKICVLFCPPNYVQTSSTAVSESLPQVTAALSEAGLESSNLIVGIDVTKSNEWTGIDIPLCALLFNGFIQ